MRKQEEELLLNPDEEEAEKNNNESNLAPQTAGPAQSSSQQSKKSSTAKEKAAGFLSYLGKVAEDVGREITVGLAKLEESVEKEVHSMNQEGEKSFQREFGLPQTERLLGTFGCKVLNGTSGVSGVAFLSNNHFCFKGGALRIIIPLKTILKVQKALRVKEFSSSPAATGPSFQPVPSTDRGDCVQLYTNDRMVHHFYTDPFCFGTLSNAVLSFETWYKMVDEAWKFTMVVLANEAQQQQTTTSQPQSVDSQQQSQQLQQPQILIPPPLPQHQQQPQQVPFPSPFPEQGLHPDQPMQQQPVLQPPLSPRPIIEPLPQQQQQQQQQPSDLETVSI